MAKRTELKQEALEGLFIDSPGEYLVKRTCEQLMEIRQWRALFGEQIIAYDREDFGIANLPALRIYSLGYAKQSDSWFVDGNLICDVIFPPKLRREELNQFADSVANALLQQFRRQEWFETMSTLVPGLNQLGTVFDVDKSLVFNWGNVNCPMVEITLNFRIDLRRWDDHLTETGRTKDEPFEVTLDNLALIATRIRGLNDAQGTEVEVDMEKQTTTEGD